MPKVYKLKDSTGKMRTRHSLATAEQTLMHWHDKRIACGEADPVTYKAAQEALHQEAYYPTAQLPVLVEHFCRALPQLPTIVCEEVQWDNGRLVFDNGSFEVWAAGRMCTLGIPNPETGAMEDIPCRGVETNRAFHDTTTHQMSDSLGQLITYTIRFNPTSGWELTKD